MFDPAHGDLFNALVDMAASELGAEMEVLDTDDPYWVRCRTFFSRLDEAMFSIVHEAGCEDGPDRLLIEAADGTSVRYTIGGTPHPEQLFAVVHRLVERAKEVAA